MCSFLLSIVVALRFSQYGEGIAQSGRVSEMVLAGSIGTMHGASYEMAGGTRVTISESLRSQLEVRAAAFRELSRMKSLERRRQRDRDRRRSEKGKPRRKS